MSQNFGKRAERLKEVAPKKTRRSLDLATEKGNRFVYVANVTPSKRDGAQREQKGV